MLVVQGIRLGAPHRPGLARGIEFLVMGDGMVLGLLPMAAILGSPMLLLALIGGLLARRRWGRGPAGASALLPEVPACAS